MDDYDYYYCAVSQSVKSVSRSELSKSGEERYNAGRMAARPLPGSPWDSTGLPQVSPDKLPLFGNVSITFLLPEIVKTTGLEIDEFPPEAPEKPLAKPPTLVIGSPLLGFGAYPPPYPWVENLPLLQEYSSVNRHVPAPPIPRSSRMRKGRVVCARCQAPPTQA